MGDSSDALEMLIPPSVLQRAAPVAPSGTVTPAPQRQGPPMGFNPYTATPEQLQQEIARLQPLVEAAERQAGYGGEFGAEQGRLFNTMSHDLNLALGAQHGIRPPAGANPFDPNYRPQAVPGLSDRQPLLGGAPDQFIDRRTGDIFGTSHRNPTGAFMGNVFSSPNISPAQRVASSGIMNAAPGGFQPQTLGKHLSWQPNDVKSMGGWNNPTPYPIIPGDRQAFEQQATQQLQNQPGYHQYREKTDLENAQRAFSSIVPAASAGVGAAVGPALIGAGLSAPVAGGVASGGMAAATMAIKAALGGQVSWQDAVGAIVAAGLGAYLPAAMRQAGVPGPLAGAAGGAATATLRDTILEGEPNPWNIGTGAASGLIRGTR